MANIRVDNKMSCQSKICKGVWLKCLLSHLLFNLYFDFIFKTTLEGTCISISINDPPINHLRYADDTVIMVGSIKPLQQLLNTVNRMSAKNWA